MGKSSLDDWLAAQHRPTRCAFCADPKLKAELDDILKFIVKKKAYHITLRAILDRVNANRLLSEVDPLTFSAIRNHCHTHVKPLWEASRGR